MRPPAGDNSMKALRKLKLVVAALLERSGKVLIAQRLPGVHLAGLWEFPGGKLEPGESPEECLARELHEELGLDIRVGEIFTAVFHRYEEFDLLMLVYRADAGSVEPRALACAQWLWVAPDELGDYAMPPADEPIVAKLTGR